MIIIIIRLVFRGRFLLANESGGERRGEGGGKTLSESPPERDNLLVNQNDAWRYKVTRQRTQLTINFNTRQHQIFLWWCSQHPYTDDHIHRHWLPYQLYIYIVPAFTSDHHPWKISSTRCSIFYTRKLLASSFYCLHPIVSLGTIFILFQKQEKSLFEDTKRLPL